MPHIGPRLGIRSRRIIGGWLPSDIPGVFLWLRSDLGVTQSGTVSAWADQSGSGHHASQPTAGARPAWGAATGVNGTPGVTFAGAEWLQLAATSEASTDWTVFAVYNETSLPLLSQAVFSAPHPTEAGIAFAVRHWYDGAWHRSVAGFDEGGDGGIDLADAITGEQWVEWHWDSTANTLDGYRNGSLIGSGTYNGAVYVDNSGTAKIGRSANYPTYYGQFVLSELIVVASTVSAADLALARAYLSARYGL